MESLNKDSVLMTYFLGGESPMKSPASNRIFRSYHRSGGGSSIGGSRSPLSPIENVNTPMVAEEEVLVIDGVLVSPVVGSESSSNSSSSSYKNELCRAWEDLGTCRYVSNCQFAHGKEELHPTHFLIKNKAVAHSCRSYATSPRSSPYVLKNHILPPVMTKAAVAASQTAFSVVPEYTSISPTIAIKSEKSSKTPISKPGHSSRACISTTLEKCNKSPAVNIIYEDSETVITSSTCSDYWSPLDDGIEIVLPCPTDKCASREEVHAYIQSVLYGPATENRLLVFDEFCPG